MVVAREEGIETILAQGVFDVFHVGHLEYLTKSAEHGILFVGTESDESVKKNKSKKRPINNLNERLKLLAALRCVDFAFGYEDILDYFNPDSFMERLLTLQPDYLAISNLATDEHSDGKKEQAAKAGITPLIIDDKKINSSTNIIEKLNIQKKS